MNGATYLADVVGGQKTGLFFDQRPNHTFAARLEKGKRMLDVFAHVGGFALAGLAAGAESALAINSSAPALALAEQGAALTGVAERLTTRRADSFDALRNLADEAARFDLVVCDPPAFAPNRGRWPKGLPPINASPASPRRWPRRVVGWCCAPAPTRPIPRASTAPMPAASARRAGGRCWSVPAAPARPPGSYRPARDQLPQGAVLPAR